MNIKNYSTFMKRFIRKELLMLYVIILIGVFLRFPGVFTNSFAFTYDVGRDMLAIWNIVYNHKIILIGATTGIPGVFYGPWWYYMLVPFFVLFGGSPQGIAFILSIVGILSIFLSYYVGKRIGNSFLGLSMALLTSMSPAMISLSSQIWNPNIAPFFVLLTILVLERIYTLKNKAKLTYFFVLGILLALNIDIEILWGILFSLGILTSLFIVLRKKLEVKKIVFIVLGALIVILPRIIFELRHSFIMTKSFIAFFSAKTLEDKLDLYHFLENRFFIHLDEFGKSFLQINNYLTIFLLLFIVVSVFLFYKKAPQIVKDFILTSLTVLLFFYIGSLIFTHALWPHYFVGLPVVYILLLSISLFLLSKKIGNNILAAFILVILFVININSLEIPQRFNKPLWEGNASVYRNQLEVIDYIYAQANGKPFKYVAYTPPVFDYTYQYLFKWYGPKKYKYLPSIKSNLAFFIIEPDPGYEDRPKWWLEDRKNDGKIIKSKTLKGGIVVQTRLVD